MHLYLALGFKRGQLSADVAQRAALERRPPGRLGEVYDRVRHLIMKALITFAYPQIVDMFEVMLSRRGGGGRLLLDSGAFSIHTRGLQLDLGAYAEWVQRVGARYARRVEHFAYFNLDVIGDQAASWRNQMALEARGLSPIPVVTFGSALRDIERAAEHPIFGLGGLVGYSKEPDRVRAWLDSVFGRLGEIARRRGRWPRAHVLGLTQDWIADRYPVFAMDSSTWASSTKFGKSPELKASGLCVPKVSAGDTAALINALVLRWELERYRQMEARWTAQWAQRGVVFDE